MKPELHIDESYSADMYMKDVIKKFKVQYRPRVVKCYLNDQDIEVCPILVQEMVKLDGESQP
jgi:hypothetical protein